MGVFSSCCPVSGRINYRGRKLVTKAINVEGVGYHQERNGKFCVQDDTTAFKINRNHITPELLWIGSPLDVQVPTKNSKLNVSSLKIDSKRRALDIDQKV